MSEDVYMGRTPTFREVKICRDCEDSFTGAGQICMDCRYEEEEQ